MKKLIVIGIVALIASNNVMAKESCEQLLQELSYLEDGESDRPIEDVCGKLRTEMKNDKSCHKLAYEWFGENLDNYCPVKGN